MKSFFAFMMFWLLNGITVQAQKREAPTTFKADLGIVHDITVHPTVKGIAAGRDELLEKAIGIIDGK